MRSDCILQIRDAPVTDVARYPLFYLFIAKYFALVEALVREKLGGLYARIFGLFLLPDTVSGLFANRIPVSGCHLSGASLVEV